MQDASKIGKTSFEKLIPAVDATCDVAAGEALGAGTSKVGSETGVWEAEA
jgi:hypothetical protein